MTRLVVVAACALSLAPAAFASERHPTLNELENEVMCPVCGTTLAQSDSPAAHQIERDISARIAKGWTKSRIVDSLVGPPNNLGPSVLGVPRKHGFDLLAWVLPLGGIAAGALALAGGAWAWSRNRGPGDLLSADGPPLDPALARRVDEELARFDS